LRLAAKKLLRVQKMMHNRVATIDPYNHRLWYALMIYFIII